MAINFNDRLVFDPKIDIIGQEVPLAAIAQTGNTLQTRFDQSYENETKTAALIKKLQQSADPVDRELATQIGETYQQRLVDRAKTGDYHNMRWQTLRDAQEFSDIYSGLSERAKKMQQYRDAISTYKGINDPNQKAYELQKWNAAQAQAQFNPENRFLTNLNVSAPNLVDDVDMTNFVDTYAKGFEADVIAKSNGRERFVNAGSTLPNGEIAQFPGIYDIKSGKKVRNVKASDIENVLNKYAKGSPEVQAFKNARLDYYVNGQGLTPEQAETKFNSEFQNNLFKAAGTKYGFTETFSEDDTNYDAPSSAMLKSMGAGTAANWGVPVNTVAENYGNTNDRSLRSTFVDALRGNNADYINMLTYINNNIDKPKDEKSKKEYNDFKASLNKIRTLSPEDQQKISGFFEAGALNTGLASLDPKLKPLVSDINKYIGHALSFDNKIEDGFQEYNKTNKGFQNINLLTPHYKDAESIRDLQTWMKHSLDANDFKAFKGEIDPKADYSFSKVSDRPAGNGTGILIELKNPKDNSTILVEPKDDRMLQALEKNFPGISTFNAFKNTSDFNNGEARTVRDIFKENGFNKLPKGTPESLGDNKIMYSDGMYYLLNPNGLPVLENGQPKVSTSYLDLF